MNIKILMGMSSYFLSTLPRNVITCIRTYSSDVFCSKVCALL